MAGMIDADGSIFIACANMPDQRRPQFRACLSIANTNFELLRDMQQTMGVGSLNCGYRSEVNPKWKNKGQLNVRGDQLSRAISQIAPHLRGKHRQAELVQRLLDLKAVWSKQNDNWKEQEALYEQCRALNARGSTNQPEIDLVRPEPEARVCSEPGCGGKHYGHGLCRKHYRWAYESKRWESGVERKCLACEADLPKNASIRQKYCDAKCRMKWHRREGCYTDKNKAAPKCEIDGCDNRHHSKGMCRSHYMQQWHKDNPGAH